MNPNVQYSVNFHIHTAVDSKSPAIQQILSTFVPNSNNGTQPPSVFLPLPSIVTPTSQNAVTQQPSAPDVNYYVNAYPNVQTTSSTPSYFAMPAQQAVVSPVVPMNGQIPISPQTQTPSSARPRFSSMDAAGNPLM